MKWKSFVLSFILLFLIVLSLLYPDLFSQFSAILSIFLLVLLFIQIFIYYEGKITGSKEIATISILGAFSAASRIPFAAIPSVQPCTFIILVSGYVFGPLSGFIIGAETALLSNFFLGQGPWTIWQMLAWGIVGIIGHLIRKLGKNSFLLLMIISVAVAYLYGIIMNISYWIMYMGTHTFASFLYVELLSFWYDTLHAAGNVIFMDLFGARFIKILEDYKIRFGLFSSSEALSSS